MAVDDDAEVRSLASTRAAGWPTQGEAMDTEQHVRGSLTEEQLRTYDVEGYIEDWLAERPEHEV